MRSNLVENTQKLSLDLFKSQTIYFKIYNDVLINFDFMYVTFKRVLSQSTSNPPSLYFKDYIYGSGTLPNFYSYDFRYDIETTKKRTMKIQANTVTNNTNYYFMFGLESSSFADKSPIEINFIFVSPSGTTSNYTTGIPTGNSTQSFYNEDSTSGSMIQAPFANTSDYDMQENTDGSIV
jgi:hypothetical protein